MPSRITITLTGRERALRALEAKRRAFRSAALGAIRDGVVAIRGRVKSSFGKPGKPVSRTGRLSRSVVSMVEEREDRILGIVGVLALAKEYAPLLEFGGPIKGFFVKPVKKKALAWPVGGAARVARAILVRRGTYKQAARGAKKVGYGSFAFSRGHFIPPRFQRAMPYLRPAFKDEKPRIARDLRERARAALAVR